MTLCDQTGPDYNYIPLLSVHVCMKLISISLLFKVGRGQGDEANVIMLMLMILHRYYSYF